MTVKEGDVVYACLNKTPRQCIITALDFGGNGTHLVHTLPDKQAYIVTEDEFANNADDCLNNYRARLEREYNLYHGATDSPVALILHLLHAAVNGRKIDGIEKQAIVDRASQYTNIDIGEYLTKLEKIENESRKRDSINL